MFARSAFRAAQPLKMARRYATEGSSGGGSNTLLLATAVAAAGLAGGYYALRGSPTAKKAEDRVKSAAAGLPGTTKKALTGGEQPFIPLTLESVKEVNHNTKIFRFKLPEDDQVSGVVIASAILTKFQPEGAEKPVIRPYTPISDEGEKGYMDLLIKKYKDGPMSTHIHDLKPGDTLDIKGPLPKYPWTPNRHQEIALIAGGTGITPMYQLLRAIFSNPDQDKTKVTLVFGNIAEEDVLLKTELDRLENTFPQRFRAFYTLDKPPRAWQGGKGFISKELLQTVLPGPKDGGDFKVFVCGPPGMMKALSGTKKSPKEQGELSGLLKELGYTEDQVYKF